MAMRTLRASLILIFFAGSLFAQSDPAGGLRILHADSLVSIEENGQVIRELIGDVEFAQDSARMFCDRAREMAAQT
jgi:hypothetical protein